ncbi:MAG: hypothetical protein V4524_02480 [Patescibacteria group bacterium]
MKTKIITSIKKTITTAFVALAIGLAMLAVPPKASAGELTNAVYGGPTTTLTGPDYYDYAKMTNPPSGNFWLPLLNTNATSCTFTNYSVPVGHANWRITSNRFGSTNFFIGTNSLTFPLTNGPAAKYQILCQDLTPPSLPSGTKVFFKGTWSN